MALSFSRQFKLDASKELDKINAAVIKTSLGSWKIAVDASPAPPTPPFYKYKRTGRLRAGWKLGSRKTGLIPAMGNYKYPKTPKVTFDIRKNKLIRLHNNVPYAKYVEEGAGGGSRVPQKMLFRAKIYFNAHIKRNMPK